jgi:hypothetical protein
LLPSRRALLMAVLFVLGGCAPGLESDDARLPAPEVAGHRERLSDGSYVLGDERELTVVTEGERPLRWQADQGSVAVRSEVGIRGARRQVLRLAPATRVLDAIDPNSGTARYRLRVAPVTLAAVLREAEALKARGESGQAKAALEAAHDLSPADEARRSALLGRIAFSRGALDDARELLWRAARQGAAAGLASTVVDTINVLAYLEAHRAHAPAAAETALAFAAPYASGDAERLADLTYYQGLAARERGDLRPMLDRVAEAERAAERLDLHPLLEHARGLRASALGLLGRHDEALSIRRSLLGRVKDASACEQAGLYTNAGWVALTLLGQREAASRASLAAEAQALLRSAVSSAASCGDPLRTNNAHVNLALLATLSNDLASARRELSAASAAGDGDGYTAPWRLEVEGRIELASGQADLAASAFGRELSLARAAGDGEGTWRALVGLGRARHEARALDAAAELFEQAEHALDRLAWGVPLGVGRGLMLDDASVSATELIEVLLEQGRCAQAHAAARRALSREESLAAAGETNDALDPARRAEVEALLGQHRAARDAMARQAEGDWSLSEAALSVALAARAEQVRASDALLDRALSLATSQALDRPLHSEAPRPGVLALTFFPVRSEMLAFAQAGERCRHARVPGNAATGAQLLDPFEAEIRSAERIELRTAASLRDLDLHTLEVAGEPLFAHAPVAYAIANPGPALRPGDERALVIADPSETLPHARAEGAAVAEALEARAAVTILRGSAASREAVLAGLDGASFVHFAGHGRLDGTGGLAPRLELSDHGVLTLGDVLGLSHAPRRVVLSACDAGTSVERSNLARTLGLAQAFVARGAEQVVAPVRPVDDRASAELIAHLYRAYARDDDLVLALRDAQLALADSPDSDWKSFRVWAR